MQELELPEAWNPEIHDSVVEESRINTTPDLPDLVELIEWRMAQEQPVHRAPSAGPVERALRRQLEGDDTERDWVSISQLGSCARQLSFRKAGVPKERVIDPRGKRTFAHGDITEWCLGAILEESLEASELPWRLAHCNPQREVALKIGRVEMTGWPDGILQQYFDQEYPAMDVETTGNNIVGWVGRAVLE